MSQVTGTAQSAVKGEKKVALITGANRGIGRQVAKELAQRGFIVLVGTRKLENASEAVAEIGENAHGLVIDVADQNSIKAAAERVKADFGRLDVLVNNAGLLHAGDPNRSLEEILGSGTALGASLDEVRTVWETNVFGQLATVQSFLPLLREAPSARIVNVSSGMGSLTLNADPAFPFRGGFGVVYGISKTALNAITLALAIELQDTNIRVEAASPGFTATALNNFQGTETVEEGSRNIVRAALGENDPAVLFSGPDGPFPW
ncbi:SDR family NAD(P)-dependent oxidoreductase [Mucilaginibacter terrae]|uniref:NAD(P)-dependent dehydrogenase (Short-subunit alcohol dehydrogenase family) n=1 Tax=Mucilaginibacter terrae TaxID=1955052 RepID=A0ABU3GNF2_9SPHI|nr:SDR family NAD(P)-dependent oxidoreductase [Mucilaginibacter terrae]MDT3401308.1 NAD(P)-dependent dehydrogenase (short-subunit alcohol dehydrogenase family) [Mucilaginibacter terrae]